MTESIQIKDKARHANITYWQIAERIGKSENTICRWLRNPTADQAAQINSAIDQIMEERK